MLLLLGVSTLAAALIPSDSRLREQPGSTATEPERTATDTVPRGELVSATIEVAGDEVPIVPVDLGDQLELTVRSETSDQVEIPALGLIEHVDPFAPARFDVLAREPGTFGIRLVGADAVAGRIEVTDAGAPGLAP